MFINYEVPHEVDWNSLKVVDKSKNHAERKVRVGSQNKLKTKNPRRARARAETRTYGTDSCLSSLEGGALNRLIGCPLGIRGKCQNAPWREVRQEYV